MEKYYNNPNELLDKLVTLRKEIKEEGDIIYDYWADKIERDSFNESAKNLSYYFLRRRDITAL